MTHLEGCHFECKGVCNAVMPFCTCDIVRNQESMNNSIIIYDPRLPIDQQHVDDDLPEVLLDEDGEPVSDVDSDEDMFDSINDR